MHFDQRTQQALRDAGLSTAEIEDASAAVVDATEAAAADLEAFFEGREAVYSDMDLAHSSGDVAEHAVEYVDLWTHAADLRGYLKFEGWGVPVEDGRVLSDEVVELRLGDTVNDRVRFAASRDAL